MHKFKYTFLQLILFILPLVSYGQSSLAFVQNGTEASNSLNLDDKKAFTSVADEIKNKELKEGDVFRLDRLFFKADSDEIQASSFGVLDEIAAALNKRSDIKKIEIGGHTNGLPPSAYCDKLSASRAQKVCEYLSNKGVNSKRLDAKGYGKRSPIASDDTPQGRRQNQRVEIKILDLD